MENNKPRLSLDEQIQHLKDKGILFNIMDEDSAKQYLKYNNNYYNESWKSCNHNFYFWMNKKS